MLTQTQLTLISALATPVVKSARVPVLVPATVDQLDELVSDLTNIAPVAVLHEADAALPDELIVVVDLFDMSVFDRNAVLERIVFGTDFDNRLVIVPSNYVPRNTRSRFIHLPQEG